MTITRLTSLLGAITLTLALPATAAVHEVKKGGSIQAAVTVAAPGDTIKVYPGVYNETVFVDKDDISLIGVVENGK